MTQLSKNFTYEEMIASGTAKRMGIDNTPKEQYLIDNMTKLATKVLQPVRDAFGEPILVNSCYRCPKVNSAVGGATNSDHKFAAAADIRTKLNTKDDNKRLFDLICKMAKEGKIKCRQIINEYGYKWVHVSVNHSKNSEKNNQVLHLG